MGYLNEFPHTRTWDSDLRQIVEMYMEVKDLPTLYNELKTFVETYFDKLDLTKEVKETLDIMNSNGELEGIMHLLLSDIESEIKQLNSRVNNIASLDDGSTSGDAELIDARVDYTGKTWSNLGTHVREITQKLAIDCEVKSSQKADLNELLHGKKYLKEDNFNAGYLAVSTGELTDKIRGIYTNTFLYNGAVIDVNDSSLVGVATYAYDIETGVFKSANESKATPFTITSDESKFLLLFYWKETGLYGNISEEKANQLKDYVIVRTSENSDMLGNNANLIKIDERLTNIESGYLPDYYFVDNYLNNKVNAINDNMTEVGLNGESFVFITDTHWDLGNAKQSPKLIEYIKDNTNIDLIVCGGDIINEGTYSNMRNVFLDFMKEMKELGLLFPIAYGNHDDNSNANNPQSEHFDNNTVLTLEFKHIADKIKFINPDYDRSFILDKEGSKTRFIFLDTRNNSAIKWETITPFSNALKNVPIGYNVIVVAHWLVTNGTFTNWGKRIADTLDAYNARGNYTNDQNNVTYDFSQCNGNCKLILCGHTHKDTQIVTDGGIPLLNTTCDNYNRDESMDRLQGTITEQAFDVVTINYSDNSIKVIRIGAGNNRNFGNGNWS